MPTPTVAEIRDLNGMSIGDRLVVDGKPTHVIPTSDQEKSDTVLAGNNGNIITIYLWKNGVCGPLIPNGESYGQTDYTNTGATLVYPHEKDHSHYKAELIKQGHVFP